MGDNTLSALRASLDPLPPETLVPVGWIRQLMPDDAEPRAEDSAPAEVDLTVRQVADLFARGVSTIRTWLAAGDFPNAYRLHAREWRVPRSDVTALQRRQSAEYRAAKSATPKRRSEDVDLGEWREHMRSP